MIEKHGNDLKRIDQELRVILDSQLGLIEKICRHILVGDGKRFRPLAFILSCRLCDYTREDMYRLSTIFEYLHAASLLHDDVLDNAEVRRNKPTVNQLWGNHAAVLVGDFLFSKSSTIAAGINRPEFLSRLAETCVYMTEGQVLELMHTGNWNISKKEYMDIITAKTAALISAAVSCGAVISDAGIHQINTLADFGTNMGIAFQLVDDLLDYTASATELGKPVGKDLKEGKITLPLIYAIPSLNKAEKDKIKNELKHHRATEEEYEELIQIIRNSDGPNQARAEAQKYAQKAAACLASFPDSPAKSDLLELNKYLIERKF